MLGLQNWVWAMGVLLICTVGLGSSGTAHASLLETGMGKTRWEWWVLPGVSSATLLATTNQLSYEASPGPLAWALTLGLFLATYVWAFSKNRRGTVGVIATAGLVALTVTHMMIAPRSVLLAGLLLLGGGAGMLTCHVWLAATKDANSHGFYSATAIGSAIGSALMVMVVPHITDGPIEFPILVLGTLSIAGFRLSGRIIRPDSGHRRRRGNRRHHRGREQRARTRNRQGPDTLRMSARDENGRGQMLQAHQQYD